MEYIEGRTLGKLLRDDPPDPRTRFRYGIEIGEGLKAIHRAGLLHRDLKPGNVMITADGHVKVTDFGLAKPFGELSPAATTISVEPDVTRPGAVVGTALYMSPEQLRQQELDPRSDLFSYGILLYELLTGKHPFDRGSAQESISAILRDPPSQPDLSPFRVESRALHELLFKALEKNPEDRYQTSEELLEDLTAAREQLPLRRRKLWTSRLAVYAVALSALVAVAAGLWWLNRPPSRDGPRLAVAFVPLEDRTGDAGDSFRGLMAADLLTVDLQASRLVRAIGPDETAPLVRGLPPGAEPQALARRVLAGVTADYVAVGSLYHEADQYVASVTLIPARPERPVLRPLKVEAASVSSLAEGLSSQLRRSLPEVSAIAAWRDDRVDVEQITSSSDEAKVLYERGSVALADRRLGQAIHWLEAAVETDPNFAMAHARLALALREAGYGRRSLEAANAAIRLSPAPDTLSAERLALTLQAIRARVFGRTDEAVQAWGELARRFADEPAILELSARALDRAARYPEALVEVDRALALDGLRASSHLAKAGILVRLGRGEEGLRVLDKAEQLYRMLENDEGLAEVDYLRGLILIDLGRFAEAQARLDEAARRFREAGSEPLVAKVLLEAGKSEILRGEVRAAEPKLARAYEIAQRFGNLEMVFRAKSFEGAQRYLKGDFEAARARLEEAVALGLQLENDWVVYAQANLGSLLNYMGLLDEARPLLASAVARAREIGREDAQQLAERQLADIDYQLGDLDAAIEAYERLIRAADGGRLDQASVRPHQRLAQIYERRGEPDRALAAADRAVHGYRTLDLAGDLGYALLWRVRAHLLLGLHDQAVRDLAEVRKIATAPDMGLEDLAAKCEIVEAMLAADRGQWEEAKAKAQRAAELTSSELPVDRGLAFEVLCRAALATAISEAPERCSAAVELPRIPAANRAHAAALLSEALWRAGRLAAAGEVAADAFGEAQRMNLHLPLARSAVVRISLQDGASGAELQQIRQAGQQALSRFLSSAFAAGGDGVSDRQEIRWMQSVLQEPGTTVSQEAKGGTHGPEG
jgi:tetratricopeptide (TPR) repeat protein